MVYLNDPPSLSFYLYQHFTNSLGLTSPPIPPLVSIIITFSTSLSPPSTLSLSIYLYMFIYPSLLHPSRCLFPTYISSLLSTFIPLSLLYPSLCWFSYFQNQVIVFLCIGFPLGVLGCIGYWNFVGIHLQFNTSLSPFPTIPSCPSFLLSLPPSLSQIGRASCRERV